MQSIDECTSGPDQLLVRNEEWKERGIVHGFTTRDAGDYRLKALDPVDHKGADTQQVKQSQEILLEWLGQRSGKLVRPEQIHGGKTNWLERSHVEVCSKGYEEVLPGADGILTRRSDRLLMGYAADCPLVFLISPGQFVGIIHASWKGLWKGIISRTIQTILDEMNGALSTIEAWIAPSIRSCCYEVGEDFRRKMLKEYPSFTSFFTETPELVFDLQGAIAFQLEQNGLKADNIYSRSLCTKCCTERFYSYRREGVETGRMAGVIALRS